MDLVDLFPKTIAVCELGTLSDSLIEQAKKIIDDDSHGFIAGDGGYTKEQQLLNRVEFSDVKKEITALCLQYAAALSHEISGIHICNSWGNVISQGDSIRYHRHSNSYLSGSLYLSEGSPFSILNEDSGNLFGFAPSLRQEQNFRALESFTINPKVRRLVLFPSNLKHMVLPSSSHEKRYSIAFNTIPLGLIGSPTNLMELSVPKG